MRAIKLIVCGSMLLAGLNSEAFLSCKKGDTATVNMANDLYTKLAKYFEDGIARRSEATRAHVFLFEAKLCSQQITNKEFCEAVMPMVQEINSVDEIEYGRGTPTERRENIALLAEFKLLCEQN